MRLLESDDDDCTRVACFVLHIVRLYCASYSGQLCIVLSRMILLYSCVIRCYRVSCCAFDRLEDPRYVSSRDCIARVEIRWNTVN